MNDYSVLEDIISSRTLHGDGSNTCNILCVKLVARAFGECNGGGEGGGKRPGVNNPSISLRNPTAHRENENQVAGKVL